MRHQASVLAGALLLLAGCETLETMPETGRAAVPSYADAPTPPPSLQGSYHIVRRGETLWGVARAYGLQASQLAAINRMSSGTPLRVGQRLLIPLPPPSSGVGTAGRVPSITGTVAGLNRSGRFIFSPTNPRTRLTAARKACIPYQGMYGERS